MKNIAPLIIALSSVASQYATAAWTWPTTFAFPTGSDETINITPTGATYDTGSALNGYAWDQAPQPVTIAWSTANGEPITASLGDFSPSFPNTYLDFDLDPDNDDVLPDSLTFTFTFAEPLVTRSSTTFAPDGGLATLLNTMGMTLDATLATFDGNGSQVNLTSSLVYNAINPSSYSGGNAIFDDVSTAPGNSVFLGLLGKGNTQSAFPFPALNAGEPVQADPSQAISQSVWTLTNLQGGNEVLRFSVDGGVPGLVPEPSSILMATLASIGFLSRRRR